MLSVYTSWFFAVVIPIISNVKKSENQIKPNTSSCSVWFFLTGDIPVRALSGTCSLALLSHLVYLWKASDLNACTGQFFFLAQILIQNKLTKLIISNSSLHCLLLLAALTGRVELENRGSTEVWVKGVVVEQVLKVLGVNCGKALKCINFGPLYFGTSKTEQIYLYNESPECMDWVAVLEDNAIGGEVVRNCSGSSFS